MKWKVFELSLQAKLKGIPDILLMSYKSLIHPEAKGLLVMAETWTEMWH